MPNSHDEQGSTRMANGTVSVNPITDATATTGHIITKNQQVIANDGVYNKALVGYQQGLGKWGLFVAKDNVDVTTNTDLSQFILNSSQDAFKVVSSGVASITPPHSWGSGNTQTVTIPHGLSSTPAFMAFVSNPAGVPTVSYTSGLTNLPSPMWIIATGGALALFYSSARVDGTNLYIDLVNLDSVTFTGADSFTWNYKYYILQETAN